MTIKTLGLLLPMLALAASAHAQTSSEWTQKVVPGKTIFVTTLEGEEIKGPAGRSLPGTITVLTAAGRRVVALADIQKVQRHDESWTGAAIGAGVGVVLCFTGASEDDPTVVEPLDDFFTAFAAATLVSGSALIGWGIDALIKKRKTIYAAGAPPPRPRASLVIKGRMVGLSIAF